MIITPALASACGDSGGSGGADDSDGSGKSSASGSDQTLVMTVVAAERVNHIGYAEPADPEDTLYVVSVELANDTGSAVALLPMLFSLQMEDGLVYAGDPYTELHPDSCPATSKLADGATGTCAVVFQAPRLADPALLIYTTEYGVSYDAPVELQQCEPCGDECLPEGCFCTSGGAGDLVPYCGPCADKMNTLSDLAESLFPNESCTVDHFLGPCLGAVDAGCAAEYSAVLDCALAVQDAWSCADGRFSVNGEEQFCAAEIAAWNRCTP